MSLKENIDMVKAELNSEEKFFEKAVMTERFVKKYKKILITSFAVIVVAVAVNLVYDANNTAKVTVANEALLKLQKDPKDEIALAELQANGKKLYELWSYAQAIADKESTALEVLHGSNTPLLGDLSKYENAKTIKDLESYASKQDAIYRDLALVQSAILLMGEEQIDKAHQKLKLIGLDSPMAEVASALLHYGVK
ncbi:MAG: hypothetical protein RBR59_06035 [Sulfurimonadaceae bacterium]|nr:hypothetical protein [Sulfurimonadaceae bacterium]